MDIPQFIYRGNAVGVGGHIHDPEDFIIWIQGASTLPMIGGYSRSSVDRVDYGRYLKAYNVETRAIGDFSEKEKAFKTIATSTVRNVSVAERLTVEFLEATLISTHPLDGSQPSIVPTGTQVLNMRLDGFRVAVKLDLELFTKYSTLNALSTAYANDEAFFKRYGNRFGSRTPKKKQIKREIPTVSGYVVSTIVEKIETDHPRAKVEGNAIILPGYGRVYVGELFITGVSRRLSLVRAKLGSPITGEMVCAEVEDNGIIMI